MPRFVSEPIEPDEHGAAPAVNGEPVLPEAFSWKGRRLVVGATLRTWRGTKVDRGDTYLKRHWFEIEIGPEAKAVVYFDRGAKPGAARWWLYTIEE